MSDEVTSPVPVRTLVIAVVVAVSVAGSVLLVGCAREKTRAPGGGSGFQDRAREAGISCRMHDLPKEQGERFRVNLYDHGSGLAVGDYDNDGHEDIYFLDQHGPNALYRNTGDGSRSEERRVGEECRTRGVPYPLKKKKQIYMNRVT